jgi:ABC-type Fe3+/spermidine/putrescine transport system ATPase subunit
VGEFELVAARGPVSAGGEARLTIRPERVRLEPHTSSGENRVPGLIERIVYRGSNNQVFVRLSGGDQIQALVQNSGQEGTLEHGDPVRVHLPAEALRVLAGGAVSPTPAEEGAGVGGIPTNPEELTVSQSGGEG